MRDVINYPRYTSFLFKKKFIKDKDVETTLLNENYITVRELYRLKSGAPIGNSVLLGKKIAVTDSFWYLHSLKEIFAEEVYRFNSDNKKPYILDCGSNIGLSVIYFKRLFPEAEIVAFEPDKQIFGLLESNLQTFGYTNVVLNNKAIWKEDTVLEFSAMGSLGGKISNHGSEGKLNGQVVSVPAVRLKHYLNRKVDFLKMDIEGPELQVLKDCADQLNNVEHLFVEYHSDPEKPQELDELLALLRRAGFRIYIKEAWNNLPYPFMRKEYTPFYDLQLNIFAYRF